MLWVVNVALALALYGPSRVIFVSPVSKHVTTMQLHAFDPAGLMHVGYRRLPSAARICPSEICSQNDNDAHAIFFILSRSDVGLTRMRYWGISKVMKCMWSYQSMHLLELLCASVPWYRGPFEIGK